MRNTSVAQEPPLRSADEPQETGAPQGTAEPLIMVADAPLPSTAVVPVELSPDELKFLYGAAAASARTDLAYRLASITALLELNLKRERARAKRTSAIGRS